MGPHIAQRGKVVFTNGCFDLLHVGHIRLLQRARALGDTLVVGLNSDASVRALKGPLRPIFCQAERVEILSALAAVSYVTVFDELDPASIIEKLRPHVLVKGADWGGAIIGRTIVEEDGGSVVSLPLVESRSTTEILDRIVTGFQ